jgi:hypothetical protein
VPLSLCELALGSSLSDYQHALSFANYNATITVPEAYKVGWNYAACVLPQVEMGATAPSAFCSNAIRGCDEDECGMRAFVSRRQGSR